MKEARPLDVALAAPADNGKQTNKLPAAPEGPATNVPGNLPGRTPNGAATTAPSSSPGLAPVSVAADTNQGQGFSVLANTGVAAPANHYFDYPYPFSRSGVSPLGLYTQYPWTTNGKLFFTIPGQGNYVCSGTSTTSGPGGNRRLVWTAGHCVNTGGNGTTNGTWSTNVLFCPAYLGTGAPFGCWSALELWTVQGWLTSANLKFDQGVIVTGDTSNIGFGRLGDTVGTAGLAWNQARPQEFWAFGYPAVAPFNGQRMILCTASLAHLDNLGGVTGVETNGIGCDMTGGSSGGGWLIWFSMCCSSYLNSVVSYGYVGQPLGLYGPFFGNATQNLYDATRTRFP